MICRHFLAVKQTRERCMQLQLRHSIGYHKRLIAVVAANSGTSSF